MDQNRTIILTHIPKTAGNTIKSAILVPNGFTQEKTVSVTGASYWLAARRRVKQMPAGPLLITGHGASYGIHRVLGVLPNYVTMIREPVSWVVSFQNFIRQFGPATNHTLCREAHELSLTQFAQHPQVRNLQSRMLCGVLHHRWFGESRLHHFARHTGKRAINRLKNDYLSFGVVEKMDESLHLIASAAGIQPPVGQPPRENKGRLPSSGLKKSVRKEIKDVLDQDYMLWKWATEQVTAMAEHIQPSLSSTRVSPDTPSRSTNATI